MRNPDDEVIITDGTGFFVKEAPYKEHLQLAEESKQVGGRNVDLVIDWLTPAIRDLPAIPIRQ